MKIENKRGTYRIWLQKFIAAVIFTPLVLVFSFSRYFDKPFIGLERAWLIVLITLLYLVVIVYHHLLNPYYIFFSDHGENLVLKFYPVRAFNQKKNSIQIPKSKFVKFEIEKTTFGERIILYQQNRNGIAKYPPVSLTGLDEKDIKNLKSALARYIKK
ncbi:MAG: hypothetical protein IH594_06255 [Bacteroidales bacterium]|nr:hypothetical protein [Bacteroidales bacterium]